MSDLLNNLIDKASTEINEQKDKLVAKGNFYLAAEYRQVGDELDKIKELSKKLNGLSELNPFELCWKLSDIPNPNAMATTTQLIVLSKEYCGVLVPSMCDDYENYLIWVSKDSKVSVNCLYGWWCELP
jgi:RES domain-containing protein